MKIKRIALVLLTFIVVGLCYLSRPERLQAQSVQPHNFSYPVDANKVKLPNSPTFKIHLRHTIKLCINRGMFFLREIQFECLGT